MVTPHGARAIADHCPKPTVTVSPLAFLQGAAPKGWEWPSDSMDGNTNPQESSSGAPTSAQAAGDHRRSRFQGLGGPVAVSCLLPAPPTPTAGSLCAGGILKWLPSGGWMGGTGTDGHRHWAPLRTRRAVRAHRRGCETPATYFALAAELLMPRSGRSPDPAHHGKLIGVEPNLLSAVLWAGD